MIKGELEFELLERLAYRPSSGAEEYLAMAVEAESRGHPNLAHDLLFEAMRLEVSERR